MFYTPLIQEAMKLAYDAHQGQTDQSGVPYIFHPFYVAELVCGAKPQESMVCAALLHDVLEDTRVTLKDLKERFPEEVTEAVALLTHDPKEDYFDYIKKLRKNPIARQVKVMDLHHNMNKGRLLGCESITDSQKKFWSEKYNKALCLLMQDDENET